MATQKREFVPGNYYHIYNRGNNKQKIFIDKEDYEMVALMRLGHKPKKEVRPVLDWTSPDRLPLSEWTSKEVFK
jgi:hypothetical protein